MDTYSKSFYKSISKNNTLEFNLIPLQGVDPQDKDRIENIAKMMLCILHPNVDVKEWKIDIDDDHYRIVCVFPAGTIFKKREHLDLIDMVDPYFIQEVWTEPLKDCTKLVTQVRRYDKPFMHSRYNIRVIKQIITNPNHSITHQLSTDASKDVFDSDDEYNIEPSARKKYTAKKRKLN